MEFSTSSFIFDDDTPPKCPLATKASFIFSVYIIIGLIVSYLLQIFRIVRLGSSQGLSFSYLILGYIGVLNAFSNVIALQISPLTECCQNYYSKKQCFANTTGLIQVGSQVLIMGCVLMAFWMFLPRPIHFVAADDENGLPIPEPLSVTKSRKWRKASYGLLGVFTWGLFIICLSATVLSSNFAWAAFLGFSASFCAVVQYVPQIIKTIRHQSHGALSIPMMMMQTPGGFLIGYLLSRLPGTNWTTYMMYIVSACLQGLLLMLCMFYLHKEKSRRKREELQATLQEEESQRAVRILEAETGPE